MQSVDQIQWPGWDVVRLIGRGGFGAVYEIKRNLFGEEEHAALKVITIPESEDVIDDLRLSGATAESITLRFNDYLANIVKEYSTMAKMRNHPNVVYCEDAKYIQHDDGIGYDIFIKMELLTPLKKRMDLVKNEQGVIDLGIAICNALVQCNQLGIIHRDIKPENIFVTQFGDFKLGDFGIARTMERTTQATKTGSYPYMAPEVYNNQKYGASVDQYSLGIVLYRLLNDYRLPFCPPNTTQSQDDEARKRRFDGEQIPPPAHGSKQLQAIVLRACAYDPKDRFASAAEMLAALKALKNGSASPAVAVPMGAAAAVAGGAATGVAADKMTTGTVGTVGRRRPNTEEEATVGAFGAGAAYASRQQGQSSTNQNAGQQNGSPGRVQPAQQGNRQYAGASAIPPQNNKEEKKKRGIGAWIAIAAGLVVVIGGILLLTLGKGRDSGNRSDTKAALNNHTSESTTTSPNEHRETLPVQLDWAEWADELPDYVTGNDYTIEERTLYRSRNLVTTSSTTSDKMDGWELYDTATGNGDYGAWSDWSATAVSASDTRDVETQTRYRYSDKETTTGSSSSMSGWTLEDTTYSWGDYGSWSQWSTDKVSSSDSREVQTETRYRYRDKETTTSYNSSLSGWTLVSSEWLVNDYGTIRYVASWPAGFNRNHSLFSEYNNTPVSASESNTVKTVINSTGTEGYIYYHWCRGTYTSGPINRKTSEVQTSEFNCFHAFYSTSSAPRYDPNGADGQNSRYYPNASVCRDSYWYYPITVNYQNYTTYNKLFYYERWKDWSSWSTNAVSSNDNREVQTATYYRYRERASVPTYHFSRWKEWSSWSETAVSASGSRKVETTDFYRYRDRVEETTYYFHRWTDWSDYTESPIDRSDTVEVETKTQFRYKSKES